MTDAVATKSIPLAIVGGEVAVPLQPGVKQLGSDKINRSPVHFADAPVPNTSPTASPRSASTAQRPGSRS